MVHHNDFGSFCEHNYCSIYLQRAKRIPRFDVFSATNGVSWLQSLLTIATNAKHILTLGVDNFTHDDIFSTGRLNRLPDKHAGREHDDDASKETFSHRGIYVHYIRRWDALSDISRS